MADVEAPADVKPAETEAPAPASDAPTFDESLLIKVKGRVVEPTRPDDTERNVMVQKLQAEIQKNSDRIRDIKALVEEKRGNAKFATRGSQDVVKRMQGYRGEFQSVLRQKQLIREELQAVTQELDKLRAAKRELQTELRNEVRIMTLEAVDARLRELDNKLNHESFNIQDENALRAQVKKLTAARPKIGELDTISAKLSESEQIRSEIFERMKQCDEVLNGIKAKEEKERAELDSIRSKGDDQTADVPTLNVEKQECYDIIVACREKIAAIREEYNKKYEEYIKLDRNYRAWRTWDRHQKYQKRQKDREERNKARDEENREWRAAELSLIPDPYASEIFLCDQAAVFLKKFLATDEAASKQEVKAVEAPAPGMVLFRRKTDDDLDSMFTGLGKKNKGKKVDKPAEKKVADKKFSHDLDTLKTFMSIGVPAPNSTADVQKTLDAVVAKKAEFEEKQKKALEDKANGVYETGEDAGPEADNGDAAADNGTAAADNGDAAHAENGDKADNGAVAEVEEPEASAAESSAEVAIEEPAPAPAEAAVEDEPADSAAEAPAAVVDSPAPPAVEAASPTADANGTAPATE